MGNNVLNTAIASNAGGEPGAVGALLTLVAITLIAGSVGGWAAYLAEPAPTPPAVAEPKDRLLRRLLVLGVIAAACVPLFLSLLKSQLLEAVLRGSRSAGALESYLIFTGLCLIAAFSARRFIDTVTQQVLRRADEANRKSDDAQVRAGQAEQVARDAQEAVTEVVNEVEDADLNQPPPETASTREAFAGRALPESISDDERRALLALQKKTYRTRTGVAEDSGISKTRISEVLEHLAERQLAAPATSPSSGGKRWVITDRGKEMLARSL
jgi:hypothetical protein